MGRTREIHVNIKTTAELEGVDQVIDRIAAMNKELNGPLSRLEGTIRGLQTQVKSLATAARGLQTTTNNTHRSLDRLVASSKKSADGAKKAADAVRDLTREFGSENQMIRRLHQASNMMVKQYGAQETAMERATAAKEALRRADEQLIAVNRELDRVMDQGTASDGERKAIQDKLRTATQNHAMATKELSAAELELTRANTQAAKGWRELTAETARVERYFEGLTDAGEDMSQQLSDVHRRSTSLATAFESMGNNIRQELSDLRQLGNAAEWTGEKLALTGQRAADAFQEIGLTAARAKTEVREFEQQQDRAAREARAFADAQQRVADGLRETMRAANVGVNRGLELAFRGQANAALDAAEAAQRLASENAARARQEFQATQAARALGTATDAQVDDARRLASQARNTADAVADETRRIRELVSARQQAAAIERSAVAVSRQLETQHREAAAAARRNEEATEAAREAIGRMRSVVDRVNQVLSAGISVVNRLASALRSRLTTAVSTATALFGNLSRSAGSAFASLQASLSRMGGNFLGFGTTVSRGMSTASRAVSQFLASGFSLMLAGSALNQWGQSVFRTLQTNLQGYLDYEGSRTRLAISATDFANVDPATGRPADITPLIQEMIFGLQRGTTTGAPISQFSADELAYGAYVMTSALGLPLRSAEDTASVGQRLVPMLQAASFTDTDPGAVIKGVLVASQQFGLDPRDLGEDTTEQINDLVSWMAWLTNYTSLEMPDILESLKYVGPMGNILAGGQPGAGMADVLGLIGLSSERGVRGGQAGRGLAQMFSSLLNPSGPADAAVTAAFGQGTKETFFGDDDVLDGGIRGFFEKILTLDRDSALSTIAKMFPANAERALIASAQSVFSGLFDIKEGQGAGPLDAYLDKFFSDEPGQVMSEGYLKFEETLGASFKRVGQGWFSVIAQMVGAVEGTWKPALDGIADALWEIGDIIADNPWLAKLISQLVLFGTTALVAIGSLMSFAGVTLIVVRALGMLSGGVGAVMAVIPGLFMMLTTGLPILALIAAAVAALYLVWDRNLLGIQDLVHGFIDTIDGDFSDWFTQVLLPTFGGGFDQLLDDVRTFGQAFLGVVETFLFGGTSGARAAAVDSWSEWLFGADPGQILQEVNRFRAVVVDTLDTVAKVARSTWRGLTTDGGSLAEAMENLAEVFDRGFLRGLNDFVEGLAEGFGGAILGSVLAVADGIERITEALTNAGRAGAWINDHIEGWFDYRASVEDIGRLVGAVFGSLLVTRLLLSIAPLRLLTTLTLSLGGALVQLGLATVRGALGFVGLLVQLALTTASYVAQGLALATLIGLKVVAASVTFSLALAQGTLAVTTAALYLALGLGVVALGLFVAGLALAAYEMDGWSGVFDLAKGAVIGFVATLYYFGQIVYAVFKPVVAAVVALSGGFLSSFAEIEQAGFLLGAGLALVFAGIVAAMLLLAWKIVALSAVFAAGFAALGIVAFASINSIGPIWDELFVIWTQDVEDGFVALAATFSVGFVSAVMNGIAHGVKSLGTIGGAIGVGADVLLESVGLDGDVFKKAGLYVFGQGDDFSDELNRAAEEARRQMRVTLEVAASFAENEIQSNAQIGGGITAEGLFSNLFGTASWGGLAAQAKAKATELMAPITDAFEAGLLEESMLDGLQLGGLDGLRDKLTEMQVRNMGRLLNPWTDGATRDAVEAENAAIQQQIDYIDALGGEMEEMADEGEAAFAQLVAATAEFNGQLAQTLAQGMDLRSAMRSVFDDGIAGFMSLPSAVGFFGEAIAANIPEGMDWSNVYEGVMDVAGLDGVAGAATNALGRNIHTMLRNSPGFANWAAEMGVAIDDLLKDVPKFVHAEELVPLAFAPIAEAMSAVGPALYAKLDNLGIAEGLSTVGIEWMELSQYAVSQAMAGNDWNLVDYIAESWNLSIAEATAFLLANGIDPYVISSAIFPELDLAAMSQGGMVNVFTPEWYAWFQAATSEGVDKMVEVTVAEFAAIPDAIKFSMSAMGYSFVLGADDVTAGATESAQAIVAAIEAQYGEIPSTVSRYVDETGAEVVAFADATGTVVEIPAPIYDAWKAAMKDIEGVANGVNGTFSGFLDTLRNQDYTGPWTSFHDYRAQGGGEGQQTATPPGLPSLSSYETYGSDAAGAFATSFAASVGTETAAVVGEVTVPIRADATLLTAAIVALSDFALPAVVIAIRADATLFLAATTALSTFTLPDVTVTIRADATEFTNTVLAITGAGGGEGTGAARYAPGMGGTHNVTLNILGDSALFDGTIDAIVKGSPVGSVKIQVKSDSEPFWTSVNGVIGDTLGAVYLNVFGNFTVFWAGINAIAGDTLGTSYIALAAVTSSFWWTVGSISGNVVGTAYINVVANPISSAINVGGNYITPYAQGGYVASTRLAWVGERGKELVVLPGGSTVIPHDESTRLARGGIYEPVLASYSSPNHGGSSSSSRGGDTYVSIKIDHATMDSPEATERLARRLAPMINEQNGRQIQRARRGMEATARRDG